MLWQTIMASTHCFCLPSIATILQNDLQDEPYAHREHESGPVADPYPTRPGKRSYIHYPYLSAKGSVCWTGVIRFVCNHIQVGIWQSRSRATSEKQGKHLKTGKKNPVTIAVTGFFLSCANSIGASQNRCTARWRCFCAVQAFCRRGNSLVPNISRSQGIQKETPAHRLVFLFGGDTRIWTAPPPYFPMSYNPVNALFSIVSRYMVDF